MKFENWIIIVVIFAAGAFATGLSIYQYVDGVNKEKESDKLNQDLIDSQAKISVEQAEAKSMAIELAEANKKNFELSEQVNEKASDIIAKNMEVIAAQSETLKRIMGSGHAAVKIYVKNSNQVGLQIENTSNYPIYDINVLFINYNELIKTPITSRDGKNFISRKAYFDNCFAVYPAFNLAPLAYIDLNVYEIPIPLEPKYIAIKINQKNKNYLQYSIIFIEQPGNILVHAYKLFELSEDGNEEYFVEEENLSHLPDSEWEQNFHYKQSLNLE